MRWSWATFLAGWFACAAGFEVIDGRIGWALAAAGLSLFCVALTGKCTHDS